MDGRPATCTGRRRITVSMRLPAIGTRWLRRSIRHTQGLDGLHLMIGEEEHVIRRNPAATGSAIVSKVFGALR
jgi:hypothetical protein